MNDFNEGIDFGNSLIMEDLQHFRSRLSGCCVHRIHSFNVCIIEVNELSGYLDRQKVREFLKECLSVLNYRFSERTCTVCLALPCPC